MLCGIKRAHFQDSSVHLSSSVDTVDTVFAKQTDGTVKSSFANFVIQQTKKINLPSIRIGGGGKSKQWRSDSTDQPKSVSLVAAISRRSSFTSAKSNEQPAADKIQVEKDQPKVVDGDNEKGLYGKIDLRKVEITKPRKLSNDEAKQKVEIEPRVKPAVAPNSIEDVVQENVEHSQISRTTLEMSMKDDCKPEPEPVTSYLKQTTVTAEVYTQPEQGQQQKQELNQKQPDKLPMPDPVIQQQLHTESVRESINARVNHTATSSQVN